VIFFADLKGTIRLWNDASELFFGWTRTEMVGSTLHRLFPVPPEAVDAMVRTVRSGKTVSQETRLNTKPGGEADCRVTVSRVTGEGGVPAGMVVTVQGTGERKGLENQLQQLITRLRTIERVNRFIASDWDIGKVHERIAKEMEKLIDFDRTSIAVFEEGKDPILIRAYSKGHTDLGTGIRVPLDRSAPGWVLSHRMTRLDADMAASPDQFAENEVLVREGIRSRLMIPLFVGERIVGTLNFNSRRKGAYSLATVERLGSIPDQMAMAIEKYRMVTRLRASEEKYRLLFEQGPPAVTVGKDGRFHDVNEGCLRLYGYPREEFLRLALSDHAVSPGEDDPYETVLRTGRPVETEVLRKRKDGTHFWGLLDVFPVSEDLVLGQITDITRRKDAEEALRREKDFSSRILAVANVLIVVMDREGRILLFNRKCEEVTGWRESEVRGKRIWDLLLPERVVAPIREAFSQLGEKDIFPYYENPWRMRNGGERNIRWNNSVTRDERGEVVWVIGTGIDITEQRHLEEQLRNIQKMEAVGTLAGGIAHDFNNIIQAIMGYTSLLKARIGDAGAEEIEAIERAGLRASDLTTQLLGFARGGKYEVRPVDLNQVVGKVVSMIRHTFDRSIEIRTELADGLSAVEGDAGQLEQTVLNLCINARDAMPDGGILTLGTRHETFSGDEEGAPEGAPRGKYVLLLLSDTGMGNPSGKHPAHLRAVLHHQGTGERKRDGTGDGLRHREKPRRVPGRPEHPRGGDDVPGAAARLPEEDIAFAFPRPGGTGRRNGDGPFRRRRGVAAPARGGDARQARLPGPHGRERPRGREDLLGETRGDRGGHPRHDHARDGRGGDVPPAEGDRPLRPDPSLLGVRRGRRAPEPPVGRGRGVSPETVPGRNPRGGLAQGHRGRGPVNPDGRRFPPHSFQWAFS